MKGMKRFFCILLALTLLTGAVSAVAETVEVFPETEQAESAAGSVQLLNNGKARAYLDNSRRIFFVDGPCTDKRIMNMDDAAVVIFSMSTQLGYDDRCQLVPWRTLTDTAGNRYYVFQQMHANTTVRGGAVKVITDAEGNMLALSSSVETKLPDVSEVEGIAAEDAEQIVLTHSEEAEQQTLTILEDATEKVILPLKLAISMEESEEDDVSRYVWVVYTNHPVKGTEDGSALPYLAHYVTMTGQYLYNLPTILPGDRAGTAGFDAEYTFSFMEPAEYTGYVDLSDGTEKELTVTVMRDKRTGMYYLGNIERKIVIADCYAFIANNGEVALEYSPDNLEWDQVGLLSLYNYCQAWDYYKAIGWLGGDGEQTPIIVLNNFCGADKKPINNACYMGKALGWQVFAASKENDFSQCLDVIAHEFTHCVTHSVMTYNAYVNDYGAINEAISDIQGQICQLIMDGAKDESWVIAEKSNQPVRSMSDPHQFKQPEYTWDFYYKPAISISTSVNDHGGVHTNSSLLNNIAYRLCADGGMTLEDARAYWFAVDCAIVPGTDYTQLCVILPWTLQALGMDDMLPALNEAVEATRLGETKMPDVADSDRALIQLTLPDTETFTDGNWALQIFSINTDKLTEKATRFFEKLSAGDMSFLPESINEVIRIKEERSRNEAASADDWIKNAFLKLTGMAEQTSDTSTRPGISDEELAALEEQASKDLLEWVNQNLKPLFHSDIAAAGDDARTIRMMGRAGRTIPILVYFSLKPNSSQIDRMAILAFLNQRWYDLTEIALSWQPDQEAAHPDFAKIMSENEFVKEFLTTLLDGLLSGKSIGDIFLSMTYEIRSGETCEIPATGLESMESPAMEFYQPIDNSSDMMTGEKSRPKTEGE